MCIKLLGLERMLELLYDVGSLKPLDVGYEVEVGLLPVEKVYKRLRIAKQRSGFRANRRDEPWKQRLICTGVPKS